MPAPPEGSEESKGPRRTGLHQERSRRTRRRLVRAALGLWAERGFEHGIEATTVDEIAAAAGVTKGTFYFHFAHKEDVLLELGLDTADALMTEAQQAMGDGVRAIEILDDMMASLARRVERAPRAAVARSVAELTRQAHDLEEQPAGSVTLANAYTAVVEYAIGRGELSDAIDAEDFGAVLQAVVMDSVTRWVKRGRGALRPMLQLHSDLVVRGAAHAYDARARAAAGGSTG